MSEEAVNKTIYILTNKGRLTYEVIQELDFEWLVQYTDFVISQLQHEAQEANAVSK